MISSFSGGVRSDYIRETPSVNAQSNLPVPFNIPNVLHNLLYEDIGIIFDAKQKDMLEALRFSCDALSRLNVSHSNKEKILLEKIVQEPENMQYKKEQEDLKLDMLQANHQFKDLVSAMSELLKREQFEQLLKFSNLPT